MHRREAVVEPLSTPPAPPRSRGFALLSAGTVAVLVLSWGYLLYMDWGMRHMERGADMLLMPRMIGWRAIDLLLVFVMWALMMAAMMLPSAWPAISLYGRARGTPAGFAAGYLLVWFGFSALATLLQWRLLEAALADAHDEERQSAAERGGADRGRAVPADAAQAGMPPALPLTAGGGAGGGAPDPRAESAKGCGTASTVWRCCFALMCVLFAVGVMSIPWVLAIAAYVGLEKLCPAPDGCRESRASRSACGACSS